jgi:hypothetical protein
MPWTVVKGIYRHGIVRPLDSQTRREGLEVLVLFPDPDDGTQSPASTWKRVKESLATDLPQLPHMTPDQRCDEFERLSNAIAEHMPYRSVDELERAMRGDDYDLVGY